MRVISVQRGFSKRVLFQYELDEIGKIPIYSIVTVKRKDGRGTKVVKIRNPYYTALLTDRYEIYKSLLFTQTITDRFGEKHTVTKIDVDAYAEAVRNWYKEHHYVDKNGNPSPYAALRDYEVRKHQYDPDDLWETPPSPYNNKKSHHSSNPIKLKHEREQKKLWRQSEVGRKSTSQSRLKVKSSRYSEI